MRKAHVADSALGSEFEAFYRDHHRQAVRWAAGLVGRADVAEDLAHDALIRVGSRLVDLDDPPAYLRRSVVNGCHSWHRSMTREEHRLMLQVAPHDFVAFDTATVEVLDLLAGLPYRQRAALVLKYWADWSSKEIGESLGCRESTVRVLTHRALRKLRQGLTPMEGEQ